MKIPGIGSYKIRHAAVRLAWKVIDKLTDKLADKAVVPTGITMLSDMPYRGNGLRAHTLDVYYPENRDVNPVLLYIHGGGFVGGDKRHAKPVCLTLAKEGYTVFSINYRLAPEYPNPAQIYDVLTALTWVREHCDRYQGDKKRLFLAGDSAGAYLAAFTACICTNALLATNLQLMPPCDGNDIKGVVLFSGLFDIESAASRKFMGLKADLEMFLGTVQIHNCFNLDRYSVLKNVTEKFPPAFISSGEVDGLHPESLSLIDALQHHNVSYQALLFDRNEKKAFHCYQQHFKLETSKKCLEQVIDFLSSQATCQ